ncbi:hypothetical protein HPB47_014070, partial [Ixodes persulcatus]
MVVVTCEDRLELTMTNLNSAIAFSRTPLRLILYADEENIKSLQNRTGITGEGSIQRVVERCMNTIAIEMEVLTAEVKCLREENKDLRSEVFDLKRKLLERLTTPVPPRAQYSTVTAESNAAVLPRQSSSSSAAAPKRVLPAVDAHQINSDGRDSAQAAGQQESQRQDHAVASECPGPDYLRPAPGHVPEYELRKVEETLRALLSTATLSPSEYSVCVTAQSHNKVPDMLPDEDAVLYVDADTLFLNPIEELWDVFGKMNEGQLIALVPEIEDEANNWYKLEDEHPYVHPF